MDTPGPGNFSLAVHKIDEVAGDASNFPVSTRSCRAMRRAWACARSWRVFGKVPTPVFNANTGGKANHRIQESGIRNQESLDLLRYARRQYVHRARHHVLQARAGQADGAEVSRLVEARSETGVWSHADHDGRECRTLLDRRCGNRGPQSRGVRAEVAR